LLFFVALEERLTSVTSLDTSDSYVCFGVIIDIRRLKAVAFDDKAAVVRRQRLSFT